MSDRTAYWGITKETLVDMHLELRKEQQELLDKIDRMRIQTNGDAYDYSESMFTVGLDFDGTLVRRAGWPTIGEEVGAAPWLGMLQKRGVKFILHTMRDGNSLIDAAALVQSWGIILFGINDNPTQQWWTRSPKAHCSVYVDDRSVGIPLVYPDEGHPWVDWAKVGPMLLDLQTQWAKEQRSKS